MLSALARTQASLGGSVRGRPVKTGDTDEHYASEPARRGQAGGLRRSGGHRHGRGHLGPAAAYGGPARPLQGDGGGRADDGGRAGGAPRDRRTEGSGRARG